jgi:hypothetical protein
MTKSGKTHKNFLKKLVETEIHGIGTDPEISESAIRVIHGNGVG